MYCATMRCLFAVRTGRRRGHQTEWSAALFLVTQLIALIAVMDLAEGQQLPAELRSGSLPLWSASSITVPEGSSSAHKDDPSAVSAGVDSQGRKLYIVRYDEGTVWSLREDMVSQGVGILEHVADATLLVFGDPQVVVNACKKYNAPMAEYGSGFKVSPELSDLLTHVDPAKRRRDSRRALQGITTGGNDALPLVVDDALLANLETWEMYNRISIQPEQSSEDGKPIKHRPQQDVGTPQYAVSVRLVTGIDKDILAANVRKWPSALAGLLERARTDPCYPRMVEDGLTSILSTTVRMFFCAEDLEDGVQWLAAADFTVWTELVLKTTTTNARAGAILQTGTLTAAQYNNPAAILRPYWNASIRGEGIIVGVGDTGIDMSNCYFIDDKYRPGSLSTYFVGNPPRMYLPYHRKVVQYVLPESASTHWFGDDYSQGHGTHIAGSIAGARIGSNGTLLPDAATGSAPFSRISMFDYRAPGMDAQYVPWPVEDKVLPYHYGVGARLSSDSWGMVTAAATAYLEYSRQFDAFAWRNPDFLSVVAAGNYGYNGMLSVTAPATAKNVITVGATMDFPKDVNASTSSAYYMFQYRDVAGVQQQSAVWPRLGSSNGYWTNILDGKEVPLILSFPEHACTSLLGNYTGAIVLVDLNAQSCSNDTRAANVAAKGALAVLFIVANTGFIEDQPDWWNPPTNITYAFVTRVQGLALRSVLVSSTNLTKPILTYLKYPRANFGIDTVAPYSSSGPLKDGRIKPDVVAPGDQVWSASGASISFDATSTTCSSDVMALSGTSSATALVTGHLALMRQYFRDGFYPTGVLGDASVRFEPSGMLLKAAAISGAESLTGGFAASVGKVMGRSPDGFQGWGRLDLSGSLPLPGLTSPNFRVQVADYGVISDGEMIYLRGIRATGTGPINAALVWYDYPASGSSLKDLVNDLDFGFQLNPTAVVSAIYNRTRTDSVNTVERVELSSLKASDNVTFIVQGRSVKHSLLTGVDAKLPQRWAVIVVGDFTGVLKTQWNPAYTRPQRLPAAQPSTRAVVNLANGTCMISQNGFIVVSTVCNGTSAVFTFLEERDNNTGGYLYTVKDFAGSCLTVRGNLTGWRAILAVCDGTALQKVAVFRNPYISGAFQLVPRNVLGVKGDDRQCLRSTPLNATQTIMVIAVCNEDDRAQALALQFLPSTAPVSPPLPPSPAPPAPTPQQLPDKPWYPYPLLFRTDFYPVNGQPNDYDYDYGKRDPGDYVYGRDPYSNMDLTVSWRSNGTTFQVGIDNYANPSANGVVHGGDNTLLRTMYEVVHWQLGFAPTNNSYDVCVSWNTTETPTMKVVLTVFRGYAVATVTKTFNTSFPSKAAVCNSSAYGYVGSYSLGAPPTPPAPPKPQPPPVQYSYPILFRVDWTPLSGVTGRENQPLDIDIILAWNYLGNAYELGYYNNSNGGGLYGGDNTETKAAFETAYWPVGSVPPPVKIDACIQWYGGKKPLLQATLSVYQGSLVYSATKTWDTTYPRNFACNSTAPGYMGSYDLTPPVQPPSPPPRPPPTPPPPPPNCGSPLDTTGMISLSFRTQWTASQGTVSGIIYDWDMVVAWSAAGQAYELTQYNRFVAGGVHGGDNINLATKANEEVVYWPTGLTGQSPFATDYHICVRWFQAGTLNVTLIVSLGTTTIKRSTTTWSSSLLHSKVCAPGVNGYVGSYTYVASNSSNLAQVASDPLSGGFSSGTSTNQATRTDGGNEGSGDSSSSEATGTASPAGASPGANLDPQQQAGPANGADPANGSPGGAVDNSGKAQAADGSDQKAGTNILPIVLGTVLGGVALLALTGMLVRWRQVKRRNTRVLAT